jgi:PAS domain S-box-containing protein
MDPHLRPTGRNLAWERYTGQTENQYGDLGWLDAIPQGDRDRCLRAIESHVPREQPFTFDLAIRRHDGVYRRHSIRAIPVRDERGALIEWVGTATDVEDQLAAIEQLRAMDERLRLTYEAARVGTWEWIPARGELRWSNEMYRMLGIDPGELRPSVEAWTSAIHPEDVVTTTREWVRALEQSDAVAQEFRIVRRDATVLWVLSRATVIRNEAGTVVRVLGLNMDVTERRAMEEQMAVALAEHRDLRERLVALTDGAEPVLRAATMDDVRAAICDLAARVLPADAYAVWSFDPATAIWKVDMSRDLGEPFVSQRIPGVEAPFTEPLIADTLQQDYLASRAAAYREEGIYSFISVPLPIGGVRRGTIVAYYRAPHLTTSAERQVAAALGHLAAAALSNAEARLRQEQMRVEAEQHSRRMAFLAEASNLLSTIDYEESFKRLTEIAVPWLADWCAIDVERDGRVFRIAVAHPDPAKLVIAEQVHARRGGFIDESTSIGRVLRSGVSELLPEITDELLVRSARSAEDLANFRALGIRSAIVAPLIARGRTFGVLSLVSGSVSRRYDETDLRFVELVARRAAMVIDNARLYEEARRANHAKDEFLAVLSHELRTPLNAIMGWTQVLLTPRAADTERPLRRGLEIIQRNARLQAELVEGLLDVARVATGGLPLSREILDPAGLAATVVEGIRPAANDRGLEMRFTAPPGECRVLADPNRLHQILSNLLSNAIKFTDPGGTVSVRVAGADQWCEIEVSDTGAGIVEEFLPFVFERFRQADSSATRRHGGLGLGLWLAHELVTAHGGTIRAASEGPGRGSTFTVRLPVAR